MSLDEPVMEKLKDSLNGPRVPAISLAVIVMDWPTGRVPPDGSNVNLLPNGVVLGSRPKVASMDPLQTSNDQLKQGKACWVCTSVCSSTLPSQCCARRLPILPQEAQANDTRQLSSHEGAEYNPKKNCYTCSSSKQECCTEQSTATNPRLWSILVHFDT